MGHRIERSESIHFSCQQMFELVNDIEAYPEYMEGCQKAEILNSGEGWLEARLSLGMGGISQSFVTRNTLHPPHSMTLDLLDGPFREFKGEWRFANEGDQCKVTLELVFSMKNPLLAFAANRMFEQIAESQVKALCHRASQIYAN
ncbi:type II toxin-antitoxin system RatA family toxin [Gilvimarinus sp. SDUM040013]|uniref:Type II toxin-antitoxin system RatA family toxin n=1 Tax=Gilvimarinus gilvus TaxID=3058038 RepID=A0ABU4S2U4_9GAMM|nr:type II toxin-antitoxin system RatA family toxin [Gilvimarinus sp. SDUM040013]MDO3384723.1 type II toxin-antitoxin system RatA family toxin [Gilvimarinus sp. SDUM040013]MDX6850802.1 type II toxin-antitoxin system RatA family toxin [Gilvimarinus sp. SDUM040013]